MISETTGILIYVVTILNFSLLILGIAALVEIIRVCQRVIKYFDKKQEK